MNLSIIEKPLLEYQNFLHVFWPALIYSDDIREEYYHNLLDNLFSNQIIVLQRIYRKLSTSFPLATSTNVGISS